MARIRTIKPDAFTSDSLSSVPRGTRWTFAGLWTYADDKGRGRDDARLIKAALYPIDDDTSLEDVVEDLRLLASIGGICRYVVGGKNFLHMPKWGHQKINRPTPAKSPPCPLHEDGGSGHVLDPDGSLSPHGALTEPSMWEGKGREGEMDREGEGEPLRDESRETEAPDHFEEFWETYGKKRDRKKCETAFRAATKKPGVTGELLIAAAAAYITWQMSEGKHPQFTKDPLTWLHGENWRDERPARAPEVGRVGQHMALVRQLEEAEQQGRPTGLREIGGAS